MRIRGLHPGSAGRRIDRSRRRHGRRRDRSRTRRHPSEPRGSKPGRHRGGGASAAARRGCGLVAHRGDRGRGASPPKGPGRARHGRGPRGCHGHRGPQQHRRDELGRADPQPGSGDHDRRNPVRPRTPARGHSSTRPRRSPVHHPELDRRQRLQSLLGGIRPAPARAGRRAPEGPLRFLPRRLTPKHRPSGHRPLAVPKRSTPSPTATAEPAARSSTCSCAVESSPHTYCHRCRSSSQRGRATTSTA